MSDMAARERRRFGFWLSIALLLVGSIIGLGIAKVPAAASSQVERGGDGGLASLASDAEPREPLAQRTRHARTPRAAANPIATPATIGRG